MHVDSPVRKRSRMLPCVRRTYLGEFKAPAALEAAEGDLVWGALVEPVGEPLDADLLPLLRLLLHPVGLVDEGEPLQAANHGAARRIMDISVENWHSIIG